MIDIRHIKQGVAAELLGVTSRTLRDWADAPRNQDGTYSGPALVQWLLDRRSPNGEFDDQRERLAAAQAEKVEMDNAVRRGELADMAETRARWADLIAAARARMLAVPTKLSPQLINIGDPNIIRAALRAEIYAALAELAAGASSDDTGGDAADVGAPARVNGKRLGG